MFKKYIKSALLGVSMLAIGGMANAATYEINMFGATAEFNYWVQSDVGFLTSLGCRTADVHYARNPGTAHGIAVCNGTPTYNAAWAAGNGFDAAKDTLVLRYTSSASYDGIEAVQGANSFGTAGCPVGGAITDAGWRLMADETNSTFTDAATNGANSVNGTACKKVNVGASDVRAATFQQTSNGALNGLKQTGGYISRTVSNLSLPAGYNNRSPLVVPFSFWKNSGATLAPITNMTRLMAVQLFSQQISDWNQIDTRIPANTNVTLCMRHAGSGTVATLNAAVMRKDKPLVDTEVLVGDPDYYGIGVGPAIYFSDSTGNMMYCIANDSHAVGYADSDRTDGGVTQLTYQGETGNRANIKEGKYDYWSSQELYWPPVGTRGMDATTNTQIGNLVTYAATAANLPVGGIINGTTYPNETTWWAVSGEMQVTKLNDFEYPHR